MQGISTKECRSVVGSTIDAGQEAGSSQEAQGAANDVHGGEEVVNQGSVLMTKFGKFEKTGYFSFWFWTVRF
jgi:hypothetical protein